MVRPYFERDGLSIYHGDCREIMPQLGKFDLGLTDPPYGIGASAKLHSQRRRALHLGGNWDDHRASPEDIALFRSVTGKQIIWGGNYFADLLPASRCWLVWDKRCGTKSVSFADCELAWTSIDAVARLLPLYWGGGNAKERWEGDRIHPTQKPIDLMRWCLTIGGASNGSRVLDAYMGSGSTLLAARDAGCIAVGIERDEKFCEGAAKRLLQEILDLGFI